VQHNALKGVHLDEEDNLNKNNQSSEEAKQSDLESESSQVNASPRGCESLSKDEKFSRP